MDNYYPHELGNHELTWDAFNESMMNWGPWAGMPTYPTHDSNSADTSETQTESTDGRLSPAPSVYSLTPSLREQSFRYAHGRSLNAHSDVYSLPVDEEEAHRLHDLHRMFFYLARYSNYYGITDVIQEVLAPSLQRERSVLDLGCGPGAWAMQCASDFPHVDVLGVDLAPSSVVTPPPNCRFEIDDLNLGLDHFLGDTFDLVHARLLNSGVKDYAGLVDQISRCVRPGGLVLFVEVDYRIWSEDKRLLITPNFYTPLPSLARPSLSLAGSAKGNKTKGDFGGSSSGKGTSMTKFVDWAVPTWMATFSKCIRDRGGNIDAAALLKNWLTDHPNYEKVQAKDLWAPLGLWKPTVFDDWTTHPNHAMCGALCAESLCTLMKSARPLLYDYLTEQEVAELESNAFREVNEAINPMYKRVHVVWARKKWPNK